MTKTNWTIDPAHSRVDFSIRHMMIANVKGTFHDFNVALEADPADLTTANIDFTVDIASIDTLIPDRNGHLLSADFFDVENFPKMNFRSTSITKKAENEYDVTGELTLHGITKKETFSVSFEGQGKDPWGNDRVGFSANGTLNRSDYELKYNAALETGGFLIGDKVKIDIQLEATK